MSATLEEFRSALRGTATLHETEAADAADTLATAIEGSAVGTPLPFEGVSLPDAVETAFSPADLEGARTGVTPATYAIAEYGTVLLPSDPAGTELVSLYTPRHVAVVAASDVLPDIEAAYERLDADVAGVADDSDRAVAAGDSDRAPTGLDTQVLATGPSATADMGTLVEGVHGPHEVHVVLVTDR